MALSVPRLLPTKTYPFSDIRHTLAATGIQPGVMAIGATTEFKVVQRGAGANMSVDVSAADSGAWVFGLDTTRQGAYHVFNDATVNVAVSAANATNPRIDQVVLRVYDSNVIGGGTDAATIEVIAGTATSGATLDNRTGAANLVTIAAPKTLIRLADVLVPAASSSVTTANIRDRRPWARGAFSRAVRAGVSDYSTTSTTNVLIDSTNLQPRIECSGVPLRCTLRGSARNSAAGSLNDFDIGIDGTAQALAQLLGSGGYPASATHVQGIAWDILPTAGSHLVGPMWKASTGTLSMLASAPYAVIFTVEEIVRQNANNT